MADHLVLNALRSAFPGAAKEPLRVVDRGFGALVVRSGANVILRVARTAAAAAGHRREWALLPLLVGTLPVAVPDPRWYVGDAPGLPFGAIGYRRIPGWPLRPANHGRPIEGEIARFLRELHRREPEGWPEKEDSRAARQQIAARELPALQSVLTPEEWGRVHSWWKDVEHDRSLDDFDPVPIHGDAWYGNLLVRRDGRLAAVLDWECAGLGDPAQDLAVQLHLGIDAGRRILNAYGVDARLERRVRRRWELREFGSVSWALEHDPGELEDSLHKWRSGPVLARR